MGIGHTTHGDVLLELVLCSDIMRSRTTNYDGDDRSDFRLSRGRKKVLRYVSYYLYKYVEQALSIP